MKWYEKFKVGQEVRVVKKIKSWRGQSWSNYEMDKTVGQKYIIIQADRDYGYQLLTNKTYGYWYSEKSLALACVVGQQLLFSFMEE